MAEENTGAAGASTGQAVAPTINIAGQYIRDLSFENPGAPGSLTGNAGGQPQFNVGINVAVKKQQDDLYAVELAINAKAERDGQMLFNIELIYGGLFRVNNVPENQMAPVLMIECPRLIFPFARQVVASVSQASGFPPVMLEPVDFTAIYRANLTRMAEAAKTKGTAANMEAGGTASAGNGGDQGAAAPASEAKPADKSIN